MGEQTLTYCDNASCARHNKSISSIGMATHIRFINFAGEPIWMGEVNFMRVSVRPRLDGPTLNATTMFCDLMLCRKMRSRYIWNALMQADKCNKRNNSNKRETTHDRLPNPKMSTAYTLGRGMSTGYPQRAGFSALI
jgi:hypothetical protein